MKRFIVIAIVFTMNIGVFAQSGWFWQNPLPQGNGLGDVFFINNSTGWAVGGSGTILKTTNGGTNWATQFIGKASFSSVDFADNYTGWAVGNDGSGGTVGTIIRTTNGGTNWIIQTIMPNTALRMIDFVNINTGWAVGMNMNGFSGTILKTTNGGINWTTQANVTNQPLESVYFVNSSTGWAVGNIVLKTTNGGTDWTAQTSGNGFRSVHFHDINTGWVVGGSGTILKTINGGTNWTAQTSGTTQHLNSVFFVNSSTGFAVGEASTILNTTNGGTNWTIQTIGTNIQHLSSVHFINTSIGWAVGLPGTIFKSTNGGITWVKQSSGITNTLYYTHFADNSTGWAVGAGIILKTTNGGSYWATQLTGSSNLVSIDFADNSTGWIVGHGMILKTTNGGTNWIMQVSGPSFESVYILNSSTGWVVGHSGIIRKTTNGGTNWTAQTSGTTKSLYSVHFVNNTTGWIVGNNYLILKTTNGGTNWIMQANGTSHSLYSVYFADNNTGWAVGSSTDIIKTTNSGINWMAQASGTNDSYSSVHFTDNNTGWAVGFGGTIIKTTNGGTNWTAQTSRVNWELWSVHFADNSNGWAVGAHGTILKYNSSTSLDITHPIGGETFLNGQQVNLTWNSQTVQSVKIECTSNNGGTWSTLSASYPADSGRFAWTVPNIISTQCKIKISDINSSTTDVSDYTFNILNSNSTLSGKIKISSTNNPISGANVILTSQYNSTYQSNTNDSGYYSFSNLPSGNYNFKISKTGFRPSNENTVILSGSNVKNYSLIPDNENVLTLTENKLNIYADNISEISNNKYILSGNVNINNILYFSEEVSVDKSFGLTNPVVKGNGTLSARHILGVSYSLCSGNFCYKAIDTTLVPKDKTFLLPTSLFNNFTLNSGILSITPDGKILKQDFIFLNLPYPFGLIFNEIGKDFPLYPTELAGGVFYSKDRGKDVSVNIAVNNVIDLGYFAVTNFEFGYESINNKISGKIKLRFGRVSSFVGSPNLVYIGSQKTEEILVEIPDVRGNKENISLDKFASNINSTLGKSSFVEIGFDFQFINGTIDRFVISADNLKIPIFTTPCYLDGITGGFENFSSGQFTVIAQANISTKLDDISPIGSPIKTENAGFKIAPFDFFELSSGTVKIFGWPVGNASITYDNNLKVLKPKGYLDLYQILTGNFELSLGESLNGSFAADFKTPDNLPFAFRYFENKRFAGINTHLKNQTLGFKIGQRVLGKNVSLSVFLTYGKPTIPWFYIDFAFNVKDLKKSWKGYDKGRQIITFSVPVNSPQLYVVSGSTTNSFNYTLISPSGKVYDSTYSSYGKFDSLKQTIVIIDKPQHGEWSYFTNQPGEIILETYSIDQEPTVLIENPSSKNSMSNNVSLKFNDYSDNLDVDVYYDTDNKNYDGVLIKHFNILNNATLDFLWNNEDVPNGEYYIYSTISDGKNPVAQQYAPGSIYVQNNNFIIAPQNVTALQAGDSIQVKWDLNEDNRIFGTKVNFKNLSNGKTGQMLTTDTNFVFLKNLKPGQKYEIYLNYFDTSGAYGNVSSKLQTFFKKNIGNNPPCFINNDSDLIFVENEENFYSLGAVDADNNPLTFTISGSNLGMFMSGNKLSWIPSSGQTGIYEIKFVVSDGKSSDTLVKQAIVYTKEQTIPKVDFSSVNLFENDNLFLKLKNFRSVKSFENVLLRNKRTSEQHLIECRRVDASNFIGNFNLSYLNASSLGVMNKDTVLALYNYGSFYDTAFAIYDSAFQETDNTPPASITDLNAYSDGINRIKLQWTATGDDGNTGEALKYDIRYSYSPILTENSYLTAFRFESGQYPSAPGVKDSVSINIHDLTDYLNNDSVYFSIKAEDAYQNKSILGNCSGYRYIYSATNLNTTISDIYKININWTGVENSLLKMNGEKIEGAMFKYYRLYRKIDTSAFELIADSIAQLNYIDNLFYYPDADYKYSLQAIYNIGGSDTVYSNSISLNRFTDIRLLCTTNDSNYSNDSISILMRGLDTIYSQSFFGMSGLTGLVMFNNVFGSYYKININKPGFPEIIDTIYISDSTDNYSYSYSTSINVKLIPSGFYNTTLNKLNINDTVRAYLRNISLPYNIVDSSTDILDSISMYANFKFSNAVNGNYYIVIKHRNSIETWSKLGGEVFTKYTTMNFDLTSSQSQAFGNNLIQIGSAWCLYSGDVNQDEVIDASDLSEVDNDAYNSVSGYVRTDLTGDDYVDAADVSVVDNNAFNSVSVIRP